MADFDDLDMGLDDLDKEIDGIDIEGSARDDDRKPIVKAASNAIAGVKDNLKTDGIANNVSKVIDGALPTMIGGNTTDSLKDVKDQVLDSIDDFKESTQKAASPLLKNLKKTLPKDSMFSSMVNKIADVAGIDLDSKSSVNRGPSEDEQIADSVTNAFKDVSNNLADTQTKMAAISASIADENTKRILSGQQGIFNVLLYNSKSSDIYYRKSLELSYKQLFELKRIVKTQISLNTINTEKLDAIVRNTGLPDAIKLRTSEAVIRQFKGNLGDSMYKSLVSNNNWVQTAQKRIKRKVKSFKGSLVDAMLMGDEALTNAREMNDAMSGDMLDPDMMSPEELAAFSKEGMLASQATDYGKSAFGAVIGRAIAKTKLGKKIKSKTDYIMANPYEYAKEKSQEKTGVVGWLAGQVAELIRPESTYQDVKINSGVRNVNDIAQWDGRSYMTLNSVIPGYLGKIYGELAVLNGKPADEIKFDYTKGVFRSSKTVTKDLREELSDQYTQKNVGARFNNLVNKLEAESGIKLTKKERRKFIKALANHNGPLDVDRIEKQIESGGFGRGLSKQDKEKFVALVKNAGAEKKIDKDGNVVENSEKRFEINAMLRSVANSKIDARERIESLIADGYKDPLIKAGLISYDKYDDSYTINYEKYMDFNISAMMDAYDKNILHISKSKEESVRNAQKIKQAASGIKKEATDMFNTSKDKVATFVKDKKIDSYFKDKMGVVLKSAKGIFNDLKGKVEDTELYKTVFTYLDGQLKPLKEEYITLKTKLANAKDEGEKIQLSGMLKEVKSSIERIEKEKQYYAKLKNKAAKTKEWFDKSDAYSVEKDIIKIYGAFKDGTKDFIEDRELDVLYSDIKEGTDKLVTGTKSIYDSMRGKVEGSELYKQVKEYYDKQLLKLEDKEKMLSDVINTLPPEQRHKAQRKLKKLRITIAKQKRKAEKELSKISKETVKSKIKDTATQGFQTVKDDFKYTKIKGVIQEEGGEIAGKAKTGLVGAINKLTDAIKPKKSILGDDDGDGHKDNSWWSILKRKKENKNKDKKEEKRQEKKDESLLMKILKGAGLVLLPTLISKMFNATTTAFGFLKNIGESIGGIARFFGFGKGGLIRGFGIASLLGWFSKSIISGMAQATLMSTTMLAKMIGGMLSMIGFKGAGRFFGGIGNGARNARLKLRGNKKGIFSRLGGFLGRNKGKLLGAAGLGALLYGTNANADEGFELPNMENPLDNAMLELMPNPNDDNSLTDTMKEMLWIPKDQEIGSGNMVADIAMTMGAGYAIDKTMSGIGRVFKKKDPSVANAEGKAKQAVNGLTSWFGNKVKYLKKPSMLKRAAKIGLKKIPGIGLIASLGSSIGDFAKGNYKKAGLGILSGLLAMVPVLGTAASIGVDAYAETGQDPQQVQERNLSQEQLSNLKASAKADELIAEEKRIKKNNSIVEAKTLKDKFDSIIADPSVTEEVSKYGKVETRIYRKDGKIVANQVTNTLGKKTYNVLDNGKMKTFTYDTLKEKPEPPKVVRDSITKGDKYLFEFISAKESKRGRAGYDVVIGNVDIGGVKPTDLSIAEIYELQDILVKKSGKSSAVGKYQFIKPTLKEVVRQSKSIGITTSSKFSPDTQDALIKQRLINKRGYFAWKKGDKSDVEFAEQLHQEFASIKPPGKSKVNYDGKNGNKATVSAAEVLKTLQKVRELDGCISHPDNAMYDPKQMREEEEKIKKEQKTAEVGGGMIDGIKMAIKAAMEFFGVGESSVVSSAPSSGETEDAEGRPAMDRDSTLGNLDRHQVDLPGGVEDEMCGIKFKRLPMTAFGKAVSLPGNKHFKNGRPEFLMIHNTAGSNLYLGRMKKDGYGTQIWIDKKGGITVIGDITQIYWHVGPVKPEYKGKVGSYNTIGIEMVCNYKNGQWERYTEAQKKALLQVGACIMKKFGITPDRVLYHEQTSYKTKDEGREGALLLKGVDLGSNDKDLGSEQVTGKGEAAKESVTPIQVAKNKMGRKELNDAEGIKMMSVKSAMKNKDKKGVYSDNSIINAIDPSAELMASNNDLIQLGHKRLSVLESIEQHMAQMAKKDQKEVHHHYNDKKEIVKTEEKKKEKTPDVVEPDKDPKIKLD